MLRRTLLAAVVYICGAAGLLIWSLSGFIAGAPREDWALMIVLPAAWIVSFWPMFGSLETIHKVWTIRATLERIGDRIAAEGTAGHKDIRELEDVATRLAADENGLPEFILRPFIRKALHRIAGDAAPEPGAESG